MFAIAGLPPTKGIFNAGDLAKLGLDFFRKNFFAVVEDNHRLYSSGYEQAAFLIEIADIPGVQPTFGVDSGSRGLRVPKVAEHDVFALDTDLTFNRLRLIRGEKAENVKHVEAAVVGGVFVMGGLFV